MSKILFCCESVYQLFNCIVLACTEFQEGDCDIILSNITKWEPETIDRLKGTGVFKQIIQLPTHEMEKAFWDYSLEQKRECVSNPSSFFVEEFFEYPWNYQEMLVPIDHLFWKMIYLYRLSLEKKIEVSFYEEGLRSYTMDMSNTDKKPYFSSLKTNFFYSSIKNYYLYQPDLYSISSYPYNTRRISFPDNKELLKNIVNRVFGNQKLPLQKYIYLEDHFTADKIATNDFELFKKISNIVGAENIVVKCHPRDWINRFKENGYNCFGESNAPWEALLLCNDFSKKVLVSVFSTSIYSPYLLFDSDIHVITLEYLLIGTAPVKEDIGFMKFTTKIKKVVNSRGTRIHCPSTIRELEEVLRYLRLAE